MNKQSKTSTVIKKMAFAAKSNSNRVHVTSRDNNWAIKKEGNIRASHVYPTQKAAVDAARILVSSGKASKVVVHRRDGQISN